MPAFSGPLFHYTGNFSQNITIRNACAELENLGPAQPVAVGRLAQVPRR